MAFGLQTAAKACPFLQSMMLARGARAWKSRCTCCDLAAADCQALLAGLTRQLTCSTWPQGIFGDEAFAKIKPGARVVNVARGGVIDDAALARALDAGQVAQVCACC